MFVTDAGVAIEPEAHLLSVPYKDLTTEKMLKAELNMRRLSTTGKPQELVDRLLANDIIKEAKDHIQLSLPPASPLHSFGCHDGEVTRPQKFNCPITMETMNDPGCMISCCTFFLCLLILALSFMHCLLLVVVLFLLALVPPYPLLQLLSQFSSNSWRWVHV